MTNGSSATSRRASTTPSSEETMDKQSDLNQRLNKVVEDFAFMCEGELELHTVLDALEDTKADAEESIRRGTLGEKK